VSHLKVQRLHTVFKGTEQEGPVVPRCYTLTHSDRTGQFSLTIAASFDQQQISGLYTRLMRDEVLAEWRVRAGCPELHVHLHVSGGLVIGTAGWRDAIFRRHLPLVLETLRYGDRRLFETHPDLDSAPISVHFHAGGSRYDRVEKHGRPSDYRIPEEEDMSWCS
jgi:hypothetical protein